jgi:hypothetical protein
VSGIAARCYLSGECSSDTDTEAGRLVGFAQAWNVDNPKYGFSGDAEQSPTNSQYYGFAAYAARW